MVQVHVSNRNEIVDLIADLDGTIAIISVTDPDEPTAFLGSYENRNDFVLRLQFHDLDKIWPQLKEVTYFDNIMAASIIQFVHKNKHVNHIIVHCEAGVSRSPAIAAVICEHFDIQHTFFKRYQPNKMVFSVLKTMFEL
ncbi:hypothetical protein LCGC14_0220500 [marine sediment metagenome]|uniref:Tyrosine specific protein phosphatases domain-containing protein n=1 Tax=marine sediment metagenome TaxID=412755 RepID=A0A0F9UHP6_9ZZZZ